MSSGERPIGAAKGKPTNTEALCPPPPPFRPPPRPPHMNPPPLPFKMAWPGAGVGRCLGTPPMQAIPGTCAGFVDMSELRCAFFKPGIKVKPGDQCNGVPAGSPDGMPDCVSTRAKLWNRWVPFPVRRAWGV